MWQVHFINSGSQLSHSLNGLAHGGYNVGVGSLKEVRAGDAQAQTSQVTLQGSGVVGHWLLRCTRITPVWAGHGLQEQGGIGNGACHGSGMVQAPTEWDNAGAADAAVCGFPIVSEKFFTLDEVETPA